MTLPDFHGGSPVSDGETLAAAHLNSIRVSIPRALDGVAGGFYQPSPAIEIGGDGLICSGPFVSSGGQTYSGATSFDGAVTFNSTITVGATAATIGVDAAVTTTLGGPLILNGSLATTGTVTIGNGQSIALSSRTLTRAIELPWFFTAGDWTCDTNGRIVSAVAGNVAFLPIHVPHNVTFVEVRIYIDPAGGHGALPANKPVITLLEQGLSGTVTTLGTATDAPASVVAYEAQHNFAITGLSAVTDRTQKTYRLKFTDESGANSVAGLTINGVTVSYTTTAIDED